MEQKTTIQSIIALVVYFNTAFRERNHDLLGQPTPINNFIYKCEKLKLLCIFDLTNKRSSSE